MTGDDFLTKLAKLPLSSREEWLKALSLRTLREMADLCGIDSIDMSRKDAITAISENF